MNKGTEWSRISIYSYDSTFINEILLKEIEFLNRKKETIDKIILHKNWIYGPNIELIYKLKAKEDKELFINDFNQYINQFIETNFQANQEVDYKKYEELSKKLAILEDYDGEYLPLRKDLSINIEEKYDVNKIKTIYDKEIYLELQEILTEYICNVFSYYKKLDEIDKDIFLVKIMMILADEYDKADFKFGGIQYGYLTFKSHLEGFKKQIDINKKSGRLILEELNKEDNRISYYIKNDFGNFVNEIRSEFNQYQLEDKKYLILWKKTVKELLVLFKKTIKEEKIALTTNNYMSTYIKSNSDNLSEFHKKLSVSEKYMKFLNSDLFLKHRLSINAYYSILPLLSVSPLKKHKLCKYISDGVEQHFKKSYFDTISELNTYYIG